MDEVFKMLLVFLLILVLMVITLLLFAYVKILIDRKFKRKRSYIDMVTDFQILFENPVGDKPELPEDRWRLKIALIQEELDELEAACRANDKIEMLDAFCDIQYVLAGAIIEFGMQKNFEQAFLDVHESNMSKACKDMDETLKTMAHYSKQGVQTSFMVSDGKYIVFRVSDDKTLKSINYKPVNLTKYVQ